MPSMKTPGVYIRENSCSPNSVVEVATDIPAFVGYTEKAILGKKSLLNKPHRITSMTEFRTCFGGAPNPVFSITELLGDTTGKTDFECNTKKYSLKQEQGKYLLYYSILLFLYNGGGPCYIVSVGDYSEEISTEALKKGIDELTNEQEPAMLIVPETTQLPNADASAEVHQAMLNHCGNKMKNRIAILDLYEGYKSCNDPSGNTIQEFRNKIGNDFLSFGAVYYPWVNTTLVQDDVLGYQNITNKNVLQNILREELQSDGVRTEAYKKAAVLDEIAKISKDNFTGVVPGVLNKTLKSAIPVFNVIISSMKAKLNRMPPGAAMAGVYAKVDGERGVWKAPANVILESVVSLTVNITGDEQEYMIGAPDGKSVNAIRNFVGEGLLVWGARTLDGNSDEWRYINVRRTIIMLSESIKMAIKAYVFEPNDASTWNAIKNRVTCFLEGVWKRGGLVGPAPDDAFRVQVGLGETMTSEDTFNNILRMKVLVAIARPSDFLEITLQQQMQK